MNAILAAYDPGSGQYVLMALGGILVLAVVVALISIPFVINKRLKQLGERQVDKR